MCEKCDNCGEYSEKLVEKKINDWHDGVDKVCEGCIGECCGCDEIKVVTMRQVDWNMSEKYCDNCWDEMLICDECEVARYHEYIHCDSEGNSYCEGCYDDLIHTCESCYEAVKDCEMYGKDDYWFCPGCLIEVKQEEIKKEDGKE